MNKIKYDITESAPGGISKKPVEGAPIKGTAFAYRKTHRVYVLDHINSGYLAGRYPKVKCAINDARALSTHPVWESDKPEVAPLTRDDCLMEYHRLCQGGLIEPYESFKQRYGVKTNE